MGEESKIQKILRLLKQQPLRCSYLYDYTSDIRFDDDFDDSKDYGKPISCTDAVRWINQNLDCARTGISDTKDTQYVSIVVFSMEGDNQTVRAIYPLDK